MVTKVLDKVNYNNIKCIKHNKAKTLDLDIAMISTLFCFLGLTKSKSDLNFVKTDSGILSQPGLIGSYFHALPPPQKAA